MSSPCTIEPISDRYIEGFRDAVDAVARERRYLAALEGFPVEQVREFVSALGENGGVQLVALDGERVVGWCDVQRHVWEGFRHVGTLGIGLLPDYRGDGLGRRIIEQTIVAATEAGISRIELEVFASNQRARRLFAAAGFEVEGTKRRARVLDGAEDDVILMARLA